MMNKGHLKHLYWRAGFGISPEALQHASHLSINDAVNDLFENSKPYNYISFDTSEFKVDDPKTYFKNPEKRKAFNKKSKTKLLELNHIWIDKMANSRSTLRERMTLFWANHFVCKDNNFLHVLKYNNTLRQHALGNFRTFIKAVSKEAAMIKYLNNKQNRKLSPNENFARELMELFTLGVDHYSEMDIKESARAFTGYNHDYDGNFRFRKKHHDFGVKTFFNKSGNFDGDAIIDIILDERQCAVFICEKIYRYFVNPLVEKNHVEDMASIFYKDYDIARLMRYVFCSSWFYDSKNIGAKIKSPIEFLVGIAKTVPVKFEEPKDLIKIQKLLGQSLLDPPNVAGWKGNKAWIDVNTIMVRLKLPSILLSNAFISLKEKDDFNDSFRARYFKHNKSKLPFKTMPNWDIFLKNFKTVLASELDEYLINGTLNDGTQAYLEKLNRKSKQDYCIQLMSLPEYQMC